MKNFEFLKKGIVCFAILVSNCLVLSGGASASEETNNSSPLALLTVLLGIPQQRTGSSSSGTTTADSTTVTSSNPIWVQEAYLKAPNAEAGDWFGSAIAISQDTIVASAYYEDSNQTTINNGTTASANNSATDAGAAYVFVRNGTTWTQQAYLKAANPDNLDLFGISSAISGDTIVIGAQDEDSNQTTITNGTTASSNNSATDSGAVYVFVRNGTTWSQQAYLKASNAEAGDQFGRWVDISGDTIVVGAWKEDSNQTTISNGTTASSNNSATDSGAAYVFVRSGSNWTQQAYLKASNAEAGDDFGFQVSISGDTIVVGAHLEDSNQTTITNGTTASSNNSATDSGAAYVFVRSGSNWIQQAYLKASNAEMLDGFGGSIIDGNTIVIGATGEDSNQTTITNGTTATIDNSKSNSGAVYVFSRSGSIWTQQAYLKALNADAEDQFGRPVISGNTIAVATFREDSAQTTITNGTTASSDNSATDSGAVYVFVRK